jgi:ABC-type lipoprotein release transport system permease subunit
MVIGIELNPANQRTDQGRYDHLETWLGQKLTLTLVPVTEAGGPTDRSVEPFQIVNEFHSGLFDVDSSHVYIPFAVAQRMVMMDRAEIADPDDPLRTIGIRPAQASAIMVRARDGVSSEQLKQAIDRCYGQLLRTRDDVPRGLYIDTWQDRMGNLLRTVENEKALMTFLFGIISLVAVLLVLVIFYMIVLEKTHDIGILRALGASRAGVASIFLFYAGVIGIIGALLGTGLGWLLVRYINEVHNWLGSSLGKWAFIAGVPLGTVVVVTLITSGHLVIRRVFELGRHTMLLVMPAAGALLGLLVLAVMGYFAAFDRMATPAIGWPMMLAVVPGGLAGLFAVLGAAVWWAEPRADRRVGRLVGAFAGVGGLLAVVGVISTLLSVAIVDRLNERIRIQIWDRSVYFFERMPNEVNWFEVSVIVVLAVVACVIGAVIPAVIAGLVDPVRSLRYE